MKGNIEEEVRRRILVLDGGLGTMVQSYSLGEEDFRGREFADWDSELKGCNDLLAITRPDVMADIHRMYLDAGADIVTTDSFNANRISLADYGLADHAYEMSLAAAKLARRVADGYAASHGGGYRFVGGSVGPTNKSSSIATDMGDTSRREIDFVTLVDAYKPQISGLVDGGADLLLIETCFDTLNCKAAVFAAQEVFAAVGRRLPVLISGTLTNSGRTLSGQTVEAFYASVVHARPLAVGFNCSFGARQLLPYLKRLADVSEYPVSVYPNAGLPNLTGGYDESPQSMAAQVEEYMKLGLVNIVGGCCGTTPEHIRCISELARKYPPRRVPERMRYTVLSGLEPLRVDENTDFVSIGERTNVAGSAKFARLIREGRFDEALSVARSQIEGGAQVIDICFDDGMIDGPEAMRRFLNMAAAEPDIARVPVMIDSSSWETLEAGLRCVQGKGIVNSISLKEGEREFLRRAGLIGRYGAAAVVMLFDERGQADTFERKVEVASRAYGLLTGNGFPAEDIIFDPNVLAVATGMPEHDRYGRDFIDAAAWIRQNLPGVGISGGVSNLSFAFRGIDTVRRAMHAVFMYHARRAGMNFGIVNPAMVDMYDDIEPHLLELAEDVVLARRNDAAERLAAYAESVRGGQNGRSPKEHAVPDAWRSGRVSERIRHAMVKGIGDYIEQDALEAAGSGLSPLEVIDRCFMPAMEHVGVLFGEGKMFLPQVVKTARVMKKGVGALVPLIEGGGAAGAATGKGKVLVATVKGDVHDIGKNIVSVVMSCNGYRVRDLGVMVEGDDIVDAAINWGADVIGLSALITPSLEEMIKVVRELERCGVGIPVIVGGATTSPVHTAVKIAPEYSGVVVHSRDASENVALLGQLCGPQSEEFIREVKRKQEALRQAYGAAQEGRSLVEYGKAAARRHIKFADSVRVPVRTGVIGLADYPIDEVVRYIDWSALVRSWGMNRHCADASCACERNAEEARLLDDAAALLERIRREGLLRLDGVVGIFRAGRRDDDIVVCPGEGEVVLPQLRVQASGLAENRSLADYLMPCDVPVSDYVCAFALSAGFGLEGLMAAFRREGDEYGAIMAKLLADRLTEAFAEAVHVRVRREWWGFETGAELSVEDILAGRYDGARMAFGYPSVPDHSLKREVFGLLGAQEATGMRLTENCMIEPGEALCGLIFSDPELRYFDVGLVGDDQLESYAGRRGVSVEQARAMLPRNVR